MRNRIMITLIFLIITAPLVAQKSSAAEKRAGIWFNNVRDTFLKRLQEVDSVEFKLWLTTATKAVPDRDINDVLFSMMHFNPLWNSKNKPVSGAVAKYTKRWEQIPANVAAKWKLRTGAKALYADVSLSAENELFPKEKFSEAAFKVFVIKFK